MTVAVPAAEELRAELDALVERVGSPLVIAHRGTTLGSVPDNTVRAAIAALRSGADVVEVDVIRSIDGEFYLFHNGYEGKHFAGAEDLRTLTAAEIDALSYCWQGERGTVRPTRLLDLLHALPDAWLNIDRSWSYWPELLDLLTAAGAARRVLLKSPPEPGALAALAAHPTPFLYYPIVRTPEQFAEVRSVPGLHLVGAEVLAAAPEDPYADPRGGRRARCGVPARAGQRPEPRERGAALSGPRRRDGAVRGARGGVGAARAQRRDRDPDRLAAPAARASRAAGPADGTARTRSVRGAAARRRCGTDRSTLPRRPPSHPDYDGL